MWSAATPTASSGMALTRLLMTHVSSDEQQCCAMVPASLPAPMHLVALVRLLMMHVGSEEQCYDACLPACLHLSLHLVCACAPAQSCMPAPAAPGMLLPLVPAHQSQLPHRVPPRCLPVLHTPACPHPQSPAGTCHPLLHVQPSMQKTLHGAATPPGSMPLMAVRQLWCRLAGAVATWGAWVSARGWVQMHGCLRGECVWRPSSCPQCQPPVPCPST